MRDIGGGGGCGGCGRDGAAVGGRARGGVRDGGGGGGGGGVVIVGGVDGNGGSDGGLAACRSQKQHPVQLVLKSDSDYRDLH